MRDHGIAVNVGVAPSPSRAEVPSLITRTTALWERLAARARHEYDPSGTSTTGGSNVRVTPVNWLSLTKARTNHSCWAEAGRAPNKSSIIVKSSSSEIGKNFSFSKKNINGNQCPASLTT